MENKEERNFNNASYNAIEELKQDAIVTQLDYDLKSIAINSRSPLYEVKEIYRYTTDLEKTSKIIKASYEISATPYDVLKVLEIFKDEE